jgi:hypothetical protein
MVRNIARFFLGVLAVIVVAGSFGNAQPQRPAQDALSHIDRELAEGKFSRIEILAISSPISVALVLKPSDLPIQAEYRCELQPAQQEYRNLAKVVKQLHATDVEAGIDARWGLIFFPLEGDRKSSIYLSQNVSTPDSLAEIDGHYATLDKSLIDWLSRNVPFQGCTQLNHY